MEVFRFLFDNLYFPGECNSEYGGGGGVGNGKQKKKEK